MYKNTLNVILVLFASLIGLFFFVIPLEQYYDMGRDTKGVPCAQLPDIESAKKIYLDHNDTIKEIENVSPGFIWVELATGRCEGKAEVQIFYDSRDSRNEIKAIIGNLFFGIPYRMFNI